MQVTHRHVLAHLFRYTRRHVAVLSVMLTMLLVVTGLQLVQPFFYKEALDTLVEQGTGGGALRHVALLLTAGVLVALTHVMIRELATLLLGWVELKVMRAAHADIVAHAQRLSTQFHVNAFAGATARKIGRGTDALETMMDRCWFDFFPAVVFTVGLTVVLTFFAPLIGAVMAAGCIVYTTVALFLSLVMARYHSWADRQDTRVTASLVDAVTANAVVKAFGAEVREDVRHDRVFGEYHRRLWSTWRVGTLVSCVQYVLLMGLELSVLLLGVWLWSRGEFTPGSFLVLLSYMQMLWGHLFNVGQRVREFLRASAQAQEMVAMVHTPLGVTDAPEAKHLSVAEGEIRLERVTFRYPEHQFLSIARESGARSEQGTQPIFRDFSVTIAPGEKVALVGHSGGGKSTFVKLLLRLYDLEGGRITIDGQDITEVTQESLRRAVALVPQDPILFHRSLRENIAYACPEATDREIEHATRLAHVHEFIRTLPRGYETLVGERGVKLSGGERQRVAIARAILADTPILILDEATSSLDSISEKYIQEALASLMEGPVPLASGSGTGRRRTTIAIAHRLSTIKRVDRILVIEDGQIIEEGSHSELIKKKDGLYRHFFELQAGGFIGE